MTTEPELCAYSGHQLEVLEETKRGDIIPCPKCGADVRWYVDPSRIDGYSYALHNVGQHHEVDQQTMTTTMKTDPTKKPTRFTTLCFERGANAPMVISMPGDAITLIENHQREHGDGFDYTISKNDDGSYEVTPVKEKT